MIPTWQDDLQSLHAQRKNLLKNLRYLHEQASRVGKVSVNTFSEIDDITHRLREVEKQILAYQVQHNEEIDRDKSIPKLDVTSVYGKGNKGEEEDTESLLEFDTMHPKSKVSVNPHRDIPIYSIPWGLVTGILIAIAVLTISGLVFMNLVGNQKRLPLSQGPEISEIATSTNQMPLNMTEVEIHPDYYHLGDATINGFNMPSPQPNPFIAQFEVPQQGTYYLLSLIAIHVDPNLEQSPTTLYANNHFVAHLNSFFQEESLVPKTILIQIEPTFIKKGTNEIKIEGRSTVLEYGMPNLDDLEFGELKIQISN